jgi:hypothetical protein
MIYSFLSNPDSTILSAYLAPSDSFAISTPFSKTDIEWMHFYDGKLLKAKSYDRWVFALEVRSHDSVCTIARHLIFALSACVVKF